MLNTRRIRHSWKNSRLLCLFSANQLGPFGYKLSVKLCTDIRVRVGVGVGIGLGVGVGLGLGLWVGLGVGAGLATAAALDHFSL